MPPSLIRCAGLLAIVVVIALSGAAAHAATGDGPAAASPAGQAAPPGPNASAAAKRRAYAKFCAPPGKRAAAHAKGPAFAACLEAMARLGSGQTRSPRGACRGLSRKRVKGSARSPYTRCVTAGSKLLRDMRRADRERAADQQAPGAPPPAGAAQGADGQPVAGDDPDARPAIDETGSDTEPWGGETSDPAVVIEDGGDEPGA